MGALPLQTSVKGKGIINTGLQDIQYFLEAAWDTESPEDHVASSVDSEVPFPHARLASAEVRWQANR